MSTLSSRGVIVKILKHNGDMNLGEEYPMIVHALIQYTSGFGTVCWKACYKPLDEVRFLKDGNIDRRVPVVYLFLNGKVTKDGIEFLGAS
jgi:hypothetical protein